MKTKTVKQLQKYGDSLCREICLLIQGRFCQVQKLYPHIAINHSSVLQCDHCFSRSIKELFLDLANRTIICSTCNMIKGSGKIGASKRDAVTIAVHEIVKNRHGIEVYNRLLEIAQSRAVFTNWSKRWWLEEQIKILEDIYSELKAKKN